MTHPDVVDDRTGPNAELARALRELLDSTVIDDAQVRNGALLVEIPERGFWWKGASGMSDPEGGLEMLPDDRFRSASAGKMVCAAAVMTLVEDGEVDLDGGIGRYLPEAAVAHLHVYGGKLYGPRITVRQLLNHTSGLANYFRLPAFQQLLAEDPDRFWEPAEVLAYVEEQAPPLFPPGRGWHYSDTGYLLLGLIVESVTNRELHRTYRERLFEPLGMNRTYMVFRELPDYGVAERGESHVYMGDLDYTPARSLSADWAGGGLVTTTGDLNRFIRAFAEDGIFEDPRTRHDMLAWTPTDEVGVYYGLGVRRFVTGSLGMPGFGEVWGHSGSSRSFMFYWPDEDATVCGTLNQDLARGAWSRSYPVAAIVPEVMREVREHRRP